VSSPWLSIVSKLLEVNVMTCRIRQHEWKCCLMRDRKKCKYFLLKVQLNVLCLQYLSTAKIAHM
jgi:hypothetical protein